MSHSLTYQCLILMDNLTLLLVNTRSLEHLTPFTAYYYFLWVSVCWDLVIHFQLSLLFIHFCIFWLLVFWSNHFPFLWKHLLQIPLVAGLLMVKSFYYFMHLKMSLFLLVTNSRLAVSSWLLLLLLRIYLSVYCYFFKDK